MLQYYYNKKAGVCKQFVYGGCRGNENRFETIESCREMCVTDTRSPIPEPSPKSHMPEQECKLEVNGKFFHIPSHFSPLIFLNFIQLISFRKSKSILLKFWKSARWSTTWVTWLYVQQCRCPIPIKHSAKALDAAGIPPFHFATRVSVSKIIIKNDIKY